MGASWGCNSGACAKIIAWSQFSTCCNFSIPYYDGLGKLKRDVRWLNSRGYHVRDLASHALRERLDGQIVTIGHDTRLKKNNLHVYVKIERNARLLGGHRIPPQN